MIRCIDRGEECFGDVHRAKGLLLVAWCNCLISLVNGSLFYRRECGVLLLVFRSLSNTGMSLALGPWPPDLTLPPKVKDPF